MNISRLVFHVHFLFCTRIVWHSISMCNSFPCLTYTIRCVVCRVWMEYTSAPPPHFLPPLQPVYCTASPDTGCMSGKEILRMYTRVCMLFTSNVLKLLSYKKKRIPNPVHKNRLCRVVAHFETFSIHKIFGLFFFHVK